MVHARQNRNSFDGINISKCKIPFYNLSLIKIKPK